MEKLRWNPEIAWVYSWRTLYVVDAKLIVGHLNPYKIVYLT